MSSPDRIGVEPTSNETVRRRRRSIEERRQVVEETLAPGASVARVARAHGVNANQVFQWRRLYQRGRLGGNPSTPALLPVTIADAVPTVKLAPAPAAEPTQTECAGTIQLQLPKGRLRIEGAADPATLRVVLECLLG